jgi:hypothetical protein
MLRDLSVQFARESSEQCSAGKSVDVLVHIPLDLRLSGSVRSFTGFVDGLDESEHVVGPREY